MEKTGRLECVVWLWYVFEFVRVVKFVRQVVDPLSANLPFVFNVSLVVLFDFCLKFFLFELIMGFKDSILLLVLGFKGKPKLTQTILG